MCSAPGRRQWFLAAPGWLGRGPGGRFRGGPPGGGALAGEMGLGCVVTNNVHYARPEGRRLQDLEGLQHPHVRDARAYDVPSSGTAGAAFHGTDTPGTARIVVDEQRGVIVGATFTGTDVAEWLHAATIAIVAKTPVELLWQAVPAFPTRSEIWLKLLERREAALPARSAAGCAAEWSTVKPAAETPAEPARPGQRPLAAARR